MLFEKRVKILIALIIGIFIIPDTLALFENLYGVFYGGMFDPVQVYTQSNGFFRNAVHFIVFFYIFHAISEFFVVKQYGDTAKESKLPIGLGLLGAVSLTALFFQNQWTLIGFAPLYLILGIAMILILIYNAVKSGETSKLGWIIGLVLISLLLIPLLFPAGYNYLGASFPSLRDIIWYTVLPILLIIGLIWFGIWLISKVGEFGITIPDRIRKSKDDFGRGNDNNGSGNPKGEKISVNIIINPDKKSYVIGDKISLYAEVKSGLLRKRGNINYHCLWSVGSHQLNDNNQLINSYEIPQDIVQNAEQKIDISVMVTDLNNRNTNGMAIRKINVISLKVELVVKNRNVMIERDLNDNSPIEFEYIVNNSAMLPKSINNINWFVIPEIQRVINLNSMKKVIRKINEINNLMLVRNFEIPFGIDPLDLPIGLYTVFAVATTKKIGRKETLWQGNNGLIIGDAFFLKVKPGSSKGGSPKPNNVIEKIIVYDDTKGGKNILASTDKDIIIESNGANKLYFVPSIENGNINDYTIEYKTKTDKGDVFKTFSIGNAKQAGALAIIGDGEKIIECIFKKNKNLVKGIKIKVKVKKKIKNINLKFKVVYDKDTKYIIDSDNTVVEVPIRKEFFLQAFMENDNIQNYRLLYKYKNDSGKEESNYVVNEFTKFTYSSPGKRTLIAELYDGRTIIQVKTIFFEIIEGSDSEVSVKLDFLQIVPKNSGITAEHFILDKTNNKGNIKELVTYTVTPIIDHPKLNEYKVILEYKNYVTGNIKRTDMPCKIKYIVPGTEELRCILLDKNNSEIVEEVFLLAVVVKVKSLKSVYIEFEENEILVKKDKIKRIPLKVVDEMGMIKQIIWVLYKSISNRKVINVGKGMVYDLNSKNLNVGESYLLVAYALPKELENGAVVTKSLLEKSTIPEGTSNILITITS